MEKQYGLMKISKQKMAIYYSNKDTALENVCIVHNRFEFTTNLVKSALKDIINNCNKPLGKKNTDGLSINIPEHLKPFAKNQCEEWAKSAYRAMYLQKEDQHYLLVTNKDNEKEVKIVDYHNSGVIQENMVLSDGLHQFLQLKHG
jgi:hypothetical protein